VDFFIAGNTLATWAITLGILLAVVAGLFVLRQFAVARIRGLSLRTSTRIDDLIADVLAHTRTFFLVAVGVHVAKAWLVITPVWSGRLRTVLVILFFVQVALWGTTAAKFLLERYRNEKLESDRGAASMIGALQFLVILMVWSVVSLLALDNLGVNVTALVAGLGVGGIAIALAVQNILGDLFASLAIILDKPFVVGDFINVDDRVGTVEHIGLKTTRVRSISGEQIIFSNADLLSARIRNFGRMLERRIVFSLGVIYQTPRRDLERIPQLIREAINAEHKVRFDRSHFSNYGASSIDFETVYYVESADYGQYMDVQQRIYLRIHEAFENASIEFAYPTQTLFLAR
jgi:small-conductance mechanosensitive channel